MATKLDLAGIQGLLARGYRGLRHARFTIFDIPGPAAGQALLSWLLPQVTPAGRFTAASALHVAFTASGLGRLGLPGGAVAGFSAEFAEGMTGPDRSRFLSDVGESSPGSWAWGGPQGPPVHGLVLLYAATPQVLDRRQRELAGRLGQAGARHVAVLDTLELGDDEPFGFHDGISQPVIDGLPRASRAGGGPAVPAGEFVLGYPNAYGQFTDRPLLPPSADPGRLLPADPAGSGAADLGRNGSYLVLRQLEQDVGGFWHYARQAARRPDGAADAERAVALAAKMVGRWPSGAPLVKTPDRDDPRLGGDNDFRYYHADPLGLACPLGAHIRRMNPRDSLPPSPGTGAGAATVPAGVTPPRRLTAIMRYEWPRLTWPRRARRGCTSSALRRTWPGSSSSCSTPGSTTRRSTACMTTLTRWPGAAMAAVPRSPSRRIRCGAATGGCPSSSGPGAVPTSSFPACPHSATWNGWRRAHPPPPFPQP